MEDKIEIKKAEYAELIRTYDRYNMLVSTLINDSKFSWDEDLEFNEKKVRVILSVFEPYKYENKLEELKKENRKKEDL